jgi:hypothetical protein
MSHRSGIAAILALGGCLALSVVLLARFNNVLSD